MTDLIQLFGIQNDQPYFRGGNTVNVPQRVLKESHSKAIPLASGGYMQFTDVSLERYVRFQIQQSQRKHFVFREMYHRSVWINAAVNWIVNRSVREDLLFACPSNPDNPHIEDLTDWLDTCHPLYDFKDFYAVWTQSLVMHRRAYTQIEFNNDGEPVALWPLDPAITFPITDTHGTVIFHVQVYNGSVVALLPEEVLFFFTPNNGISADGFSSLETLYDSVALELQAHTYNAALFENDLNVGSIFSMPSADKDIIDENDRILRDKYSHPENAGRHLILYGDAKLLRDGAMAIKDINFPELVKVTRQMACTALNVPESLLGVPDNTNRSTGQVHERNTFINTVRPWRDLINRQFTKQFIRRAWKNNAISLKEPLSALLHSAEEIDTASKVADMGVAFYNEIRQMVGWPKVPNGDYPVMKIPGAGGFIRPDLTAMPGLGDPHFSFSAYERERQQKEYESQQATAMGGQATPNPLIAPRSQDATQLDPIAARVIDLTRSVEYDEYGDVVERRTPVAPGLRGGGAYYTKTGGIRYGQKPANDPRKRLDPSKPDPTANQLTNPRDPNLPKQLTPQDHATAVQARTQVETLFSQALDQNITDEEFFNQMEQAGWDGVSGADSFSTPKDAVLAAETLASQYTDTIYTVLGSEGVYKVMQKPMSDAAVPQGIGEPGGQQPARRSLLSEQWAQTLREEEVPHEG